MEAICFIGLGHMGQPMAEKLLNAGHELSVYDIVESNAKTLVKQGASLMLTTLDQVKNADVIITMLQTGEQVREVCLREGGLFELAKKNALYMDCSSIDISVTHELHHLAEEKSICMIDSPVSGGVSGAVAGTLTFMAGGKAADFNQAKYILEKMGTKVIHAGQAGMGQAAKICNNLILGISMIAVSEGFSLADKLGLNPHQFFEIASNASSQCWSMTSYCPFPGVLPNVPSSHGYKAGFMAKMMLKDLMLGVNAANSVNASIPLGEIATELYSMFVNQGNAEMDFSGIINMIGNYPPIDKL